MIESAFCAASMDLIARDLAAGIDAVGDHDDRFAAHLALQLFVGRQVHGVIEDGPRLVLRGRHGTGVHSADRDAQPQLVEAVQKQLGRVGGILEQLGFGAEADQEGFVLLPQNVREEIVGRAAFHVDQPLLALAGVHQQRRASEARRSRA